MVCKTFLPLLLISTLLFSLEAKKQSNKTFHQPSASYKNVTPDTVKGDMLTTVPHPGSQVDYDRFHALLHEVNLSPESIASTKTTAGLKHNITKLKELLKKQNVRNDEELRFSTYALLGNEHLRLYSLSGRSDQQYVNQAEKYSKQAIAIFKDRPSYKADLAVSYSVLTSAYFFKGQLDQAISLMKYLIANDQHIGYGMYKNWYAVFQVQQLENLAEQGKLSKKQTKGIWNYFSMIADKYDNEVGVRAQIALVKHDLHTHQRDKAMALAKSIEQRLTSLHNPKFEKQYWDGLKYRVESLDKKAKRDTAYFDLKAEMIKSAGISSFKNINEYQISVILKDPYKSKFTQITGENVGNTLVIRYKGKKISPSSPRINQPIKSGRFTIGMFDKRKKAEKVRKRILKNN